MKRGPGKSDMRAVSYLFEQGCSIEEVSKRLSIHIDGLKPYAPKVEPKKKVAKKKKVVNKDDKPDTDLQSGTE